MIAGHQKKPQTDKQKRYMSHSQGAVVSSKVEGLRGGLRVQRVGGAGTYTHTYIYIYTHTHIYSSFGA